MSKPYLVVEIVDGVLGRIIEKPDFDDAVAAVVELAKKHDPSLVAEQVSGEVAQDLNWASNSGNAWVYIAQSED